MGKEKEKVAVLNRNCFIVISAWGGLGDAGEAVNEWRLDVDDQEEEEGRKDIQA